MAGLLDQLMRAQLPQSGSGLLGQIPGLPPLANDIAAPTALPQAADAYLQWRQNNLNAPAWQQAFGLMAGPGGEVIPLRNGLLMNGQRIIPALGSHEDLALRLLEPSFKAAATNPAISPYTAAKNDALMFSGETAQKVRSVLDQWEKAGARPAMAKAP